MHFERDVRGVAAVDQPLLLVAAAAADRHARPDDIALNERRVPHHRQQIADAPAVERHVGDGLVFDKLPDGGALGFEQRHGTGHCHRFAQLAQFHRDIQPERASRLQHDARSRILAKALALPPTACTLPAAAE